MKKYLLVAGIALTLLLIQGCGLQTLHPIFTENDLIFDARLLGTWGTEKGDTLEYKRATKKDLDAFSETLQKNAGKVYLLRQKSDDGKEASYYAFLVKLGKQYFLDYYPVGVRSDIKLDDFFAAHYIKMHTISRVNILDNSSVKISQFDDSYMKKLIEQKNIRIRHEVLDDGNYLITASTEELQQYISKYSDISEAYYENKTFTRIINY